MSSQDRQSAVPATPTAEKVKPFPVRPDAAPEAPAAVAEVASPVGRKSRKKPVILGTVLVALAVAGGLYGHEWWTNGRYMVKTDDAYLQADIADVSSRIQGYVSEIAVTENDHVAAGDVLLRLDDGDYRIALDLARNKLVTLDETLNRIDAQIMAAEAAVTEAEAQKTAVEAALRNAKSTADRTRDLATSKVASQAQLDTATAALDTAMANLAGADASIVSARANVAVLQAERAETAGEKRGLELDVKQAQRDLDLTVMRAPSAGIVTNLSPQRGDLVSPGARLAAIVPDDGIYVEAFYKETQLADLGPGAHARVTIDALKGKVFDGVVTSTAPAAGSVFSLLPPDNATGNFTKIVQRVPVRISLPADALATGQLRAGLSAVVEVDSRTRPQN